MTAKSERERELEREVWCLRHLLSAFTREESLLNDSSSSAMWREHKYRGGPPPARLKRMQLAHEVRARKAGVPWEMVDLRVVYRNHQGKCGICRSDVPLDVVTFDHILPFASGGPHVLSNLQPAHYACNSAKGDRPWNDSRH